MFRRLILGCAVAALALTGAIAAHAGDALVELGAYLVNGVVACGNCHNTRSPDMRFIEGMEFAGGLEVVEKPFTARVPNITHNMETGIGAWSDAEIATAITTGMRPDGSQIHPIMPSGFYATMEKADVDALVAFLRTVKPVVNAVK